MTLNKLSLTNVTFEGMFHNVITMEVIEELFKAPDVKIAIKNFWTSIRDFIQDCNNLIKNNKKCELWVKPAPGLINPYNATPEEGKKIQIQTFFFVVFKTAILSHFIFLRNFIISCILEIQVIVLYLYGNLCDFLI